MHVGLTGRMRTSALIFADKASGGCESVVSLLHQGTVVVHSGIEEKPMSTQDPEVPEAPVETPPESPQEEPGQPPSEQPPATPQEFPMEQEPFTPPTPPDEAKANDRPCILK